MKGKLASGLIRPAELAIIALLLFAVVLTQSYLNVLVFIPLIVMLTFWFWMSGNTVMQAKLGLFTICLGSEMPIYVFCAFLFFLMLFEFAAKGRKTVKTYSVGIFLALIFGVGFVAYLISQVYEVNSFSYFFYLITFGSLTAPYFYFSRKVFSQGERKNILHFLYLLAFGQCLISLLYITDVGVAEILTKSSTPDLVKGTLDSSNSLGYLLLLVLVLNVNWLLENKIKLGKLLVLLLMLGVAFLSDSKAQLVALAASVFIMILFIDFFLIHKRKLLVKTMAIALVIFIPFFVVQNINILFQKYDSYITGNNNKKLMYYSRAVNYENRPMIQYLIGTGPGTCGSRAANARAYDVLYKGRDAFKLPAFIPAFSSRHTVNMLGDLYTQGYAESTFERSALLGNPFNSIAAFFVELGVIGFAFLLSLFVFVIAQCIHVFNHVKSGIKDKNLALGLILLTLIIIITSMIDQVLERGMMMYLFWFMCAVLINTRRELRSKSS